MRRDEILRLAFAVCLHPLGSNNMRYVRLTFNLPLIIFILDKFVSRPYFGDTETVITVQQGEAAFFNCHVFNLANQTVSQCGGVNRKYILVWVHIISELYFFIKGNVLLWI